MSDVAISDVVNGCPTEADGESAQGGSSPSPKGMVGSEDKITSIDTCGGANTSKFSAFTASLDP